jgi:hypothetical protein
MRRRPAAGAVTWIATLRVNRSTLDNVNQKSYKKLSIACPEAFGATILAENDGTYTGEGMLQARKGP